MSMYMPDILAILYEFFFYWRKIVLQYCDGLCCTSTYIGYNNIYIPPSGAFLSPHATPQVITENRAELPVQ